MAVHSEETLNGFGHFLDEFEDEERENFEFPAAEGVDDIEDCDDDTDDEPVEESSELKSSKWMNLPSNLKFSKTYKMSYIPGPRGDAMDITNEAELLSLFITDEMVSKIAFYTNQQIEIAQSKFTCRQGYVGPTDEVEIRALIGLLYFGGVLRNSNLNLEDFFSPIFGPPIFRYSFSKNRFEFLLCYLSFDDKNTRKDRLSNDKFAPFREIWSMFEEKCAEYYIPTESLTVDEGLRFLGVKLVLLCDSRTSYFMGGIPCVEKLRKNTKDFKIQSVLKLADLIGGSHRNVTCGYRFSSTKLADALTEKKLTLVGPLQKNTSQITQAMLSNKTIGTSEYYSQNDKILVSFVPKTDEKLFVLSTAHSVNETDEKEESIVDFYFSTKDAVNILNKVCCEKTTRRISRRWPMRFFYSLLDLSALNAYIIYKWNNKNESTRTHERRNFLKNLALSLTKPLMERRFSNQRLPKEMRSSIGKLLGLVSPDEHIVTPGTGKRKRCYFCAPSLDRKGRSHCAKCNVSLCGVHKVIICPICTEHNAVESNMEE